jgi:4'-phosphopantetheinyl transferase
MLLWALNIATEKEALENCYEAAIQIIDVREKTKIRKFVHQRDRFSSLVGQLMIRKGIAQCCGFPIQNIVILRNEKERPFVKNPICDFNVSHHGEWVVMGISTSNRIGIDVTKLDPNIPLDAFDSVFSQQEWYWIYGAEKSEQHKRFSCLWALKEAYVKHTGMGITVDLTLISFSLEPTQASEYYQCHVWAEPLSISLQEEGRHVPLFFRLEMLDSEHILAQCVKVKEPIPIQKMSLSQIYPF